MSITELPIASTVAHRPTGWDLSELLPADDPSALARRFATLDGAAAAFEAYREELSADLTPERLLEILQAYETVLEAAWILSGYSSLAFSADTQDRRILSLHSKVEEFLTGIHNRILFFTLWWRNLAAEPAARLLPPRERHPDQRHFLEELRRFAPYTLDERREQLVNLKNANGVDALLTLYSMLANRLEFTLEVDGEPTVYTRDGMMRFAYSPDPAARAGVYTELYRVYERESAVLGQIYVHRVRDWRAENVEVRGVPSPMAVRNLSNDVPGEAVEALLAVCRENRGVFQRYFKLKAGWLGMERLRRYDIYAPLTSSDREVPYEDAVTLVLDTFRSFHPRFAELAERVFAEGHIDSEVRKGKRGGAMCSTVLPTLTPWVMVNYTGRLRDVATLAHELGHAVHSMLANEHTTLTQQASLPLAETASVFGEMLVTERVLAGESDPLARRELLVKAVDDIYATVLRQSYFVLFERDAHAAIAAGRSLEELETLYLENLAEQFGDSVIVPPEFRLEWLTIPHIYHSPFYCYAYSFGQLLVLSLYRRYQSEGEAFKPAYLRLLAHGGAARPEEILSEAGIDMRDPGFWQSGFRVVEEMVDELEAL